MKKIQPFLPIAPLAVALFFIVREYRVFHVMVLPKNVSIFGANENPFVDLKSYYYYPLYFALSVALVLATMLAIFVLAIKKRVYNQALALTVISVVALYIVNLNSFLSGILLYKNIYDVSEHGREIMMKKSLDLYTKCGCLECVQNCKETDR